MNHEADVLLAMRKLRNIELQIAVEAGLGQLNLSRQMRILALDALVPVTSASSGVRSISIGDLTAELAGTRSEFGVHLRTDLDGQIQGFEDRFMPPFGLALDPPDVSHETVVALLESVMEAEYGPTLLPFGATRNTQPLVLTGSCGLRTDARFLTMKTKNYPLTFPMFIYLPQRRQHRQIVEFLDWLRSPPTQLVI